MVGAGAPASPCTSDLTLTPLDAAAIAPQLTATTSTDDLTPLQADAIAPQLTETASTGALTLTWDTPAANCTYELYASPDPYFAASPQTLLDDTLLPGIETFTLDVSQEAGNHFYAVRAANCLGDDVAESNKAGVVTFPLNSGG